ncbi:hypothetical protein UCCLBBS449_0654 [Levilactobacillus brevis]|uniref:Phosphatidic acid phosphatase type 2/haloperoxidase domain-containing protein n=1 Tax=Levilactobacillus brevis TaxID=1580 RepID=A0A5B7XYL7_LEVBR|nr:hypothetical protein UCCLBBS449_0654 [Levilactobacillus brevis]
MLGGIAVKKWQYQQQIAIGCLGLFVLLAVSVMRQASWLIQVDQKLVDAINVSGLSQHVRILAWLTSIGSPAVTGGVVILLILFLWRIHQVWWAGLLTVALAGGDGLLIVLKMVIARQRPGNPVIADSGFSFPSGHVFSTMLVACMVVTLLWHWLGKNWITGGITVLIGLGVIAVLLSRLGLRAHYPSDTIGSLLLASGWWAQLLAIFQRLIRQSTISMES